MIHLLKKFNYWLLGLTHKLVLYLTSNFTYLSVDYQPPLLFHCIMSNTLGGAMHTKTYNISNFSKWPFIKENEKKVIKKEKRIIEKEFATLKSTMRMVSLISTCELLFLLSLLRYLLYPKHFFY